MEPRWAREPAPSERPGQAQMLAPAVAQQGPVQRTPHGPAQAQGHPLHPERRRGPPLAQAPEPVPVFPGCVPGPQPVAPTWFVPADSSAACAVPCLACCQQPRQLPRRSRRLASQRPARLADERRRNSAPAVVPANVGAGGAGTTGARTTGCGNGSRGERSGHRRGSQRDGCYRRRARSGRCYRSRHAGPERHGEPVLSSQPAPTVAPPERELLSERCAVPARCVALRPPLPVSAERLHAALLISLVNAEVPARAPAAKLVPKPVPARWPAAWMVAAALVAAVRVSVSGSSGASAQLGGGSSARKGRRYRGRECGSCYRRKAGRGRHGRYTGRGSRRGSQQCGSGNSSRARGRRYRRGNYCRSRNRTWSRRYRRDARCGSCCRQSALSVRSSSAYIPGERGGTGARSTRQIAAETNACLSAGGLDCRGRVGGHRGLLPPRRTCGSAELLILASHTHNSSAGAVERCGESTGGRLDLAD